MTDESRQSRSHGRQSVTEWLDQLQGPEAEGAAQRLWERFATRLLRVVRGRMRGKPLALGDEDDVVAEAFANAVFGVQRGAFRRLANREDLWQVLMMLATRRAIDYQRRETRAKYSIDDQQISVESAGGPQTSKDREEILGGPGLAQAITDELGTLLAGMNDPTLQQIVLLKLEGVTNRRIADEVGCSLRSVERKLSLLRSIWKRAANDE